MTYVFLTIGLALLIFGGNTLVDNAVKLAKHLGVSPLLIGLVLVGFGTSTPELTASLLSAFQGSPGIAVGNVIGSNTANILLVLGLAALIRPVPVDVAAFKRDGLFLAVSTLLLTGTVWLGHMGRLIGTVFVGLLIFYVFYSYKSDKKLSATKTTRAPIQQMILPAILCITGIALTMLGAKLLVDNAIILAKDWGVSEAVIGLTIVAVGTSLPELAASVIAAVKAQSGVAFGNVVGSNIYNALFILGLTAVLVPVPTTEFRLDSLWMLGATAALMTAAFWQHRFSRIVGALFLITYAYYVTTLF